MITNSEFDFRICVGYPVCVPNLRHWINKTAKVDKLRFVLVS